LLPRQTLPAQRVLVRLREPEFHLQELAALLQVRVQQVGRKLPQESAH
jgi:hypothetical protein